MKTSRRALVVMLLLAALVALPSVAYATDSFVLATEEPTDDGGTEAPQFEEGQEPAEIAPAESESETEQPWTARFLAPTVLAIGLVALIGSVAYYGIRVRGRYEVVD